METITYISDDKFRYNHDDWTDVQEITSSKALHNLHHTHKPYDHTRRPVYGILTEPIRGNLKKGDKIKSKGIEGNIEKLGLLETKIVINHYF